MKKDLLTIKEIVDRITVEDYEERLESAKKELEGLNSGAIEVNGIKYTSEKERKDAIKRKERHIKYIKELIEKVKENKEKMEELVEEVTGLVDKKTLLHGFDFYLDSVAHSKRSNNKSHNRLYHKSIKPIKNSLIKIDKMFYSTMKEISQTSVKIFVEKGNYGWGFWSTDSLNKVMLDNKINLEKKDLSRIITEERTSYFDEELSMLGVDVDRLEKARKSIENKPVRYDLTWEGRESFDKLEQIMRFKEANNNSKYNRSIELSIEKYNEVIELSKEIWYKTEILESFKNTPIINDEYYKSIKDEILEQERELFKLHIEADKFYQKCGLEQLVTLRLNLEKLNRESKELYERIKDLELQGKYEEARALRLREEYSNLRYEMIKILMSNPELNRPEYNINIEKIINKEKAMYEIEIEQPQIEQEQPEVTKEEPVVEQKQSEIIQEHPQIVQEPVVEQEKSEVKEEPMVEQKQPQVDIYDLKVLASTYRSNYMFEKLNKTELGKVDFSKYIEIVAPDQKELITYIKDMENQTRTMYADYLKDVVYRRENGYKLTTFKDFVRINYQVQDYYDLEIPVEIEQELSSGRSL